jgi:hypothetical protein
VANPSGATSSHSNPSGEGKLFGQPKTLNDDYDAISSVRKSKMISPSLVGGGGVVLEKAEIGSFSNPGDCRSASCHFRTVREKSLCISFSFDPATLKCSNCPGRGPHGMEEGEWDRNGGGGGG